MAVISDKKLAFMENQMKRKLEFSEIMLLEVLETDKGRKLQREHGLIALYEKIKQEISEALN